MLNLRHEQRVAAPAPAVWAALADFSRIDRFHPNVADVDQITGHDRGPGAARRCNFYDGSSVVERVTEWNEGRGYSVELSDAIGMPLRTAVATLEVVADDDGALVTMHMAYRVKYGPVGWLLGVTMMRAMMRGVFAKVIRGLEYYALTGRPVGREVPESAAAAPA